MLLVLSESWKMLAYRGVAATGFGISALLWPDETAGVLVFLFGGFAFVDGLVHGWFGTRIRDFAHRGWLASLRSTAGVVPGLVALLLPGVVLPELLDWIAGWAVVTGALEITEGFWLRREGHRERLLLLLGLQSVTIGGVLIFRSSAATILGATGLLAGYSVPIGFLLLGLAARLRTLTRRVQNTHPKLWALRNG